MARPAKSQWEFGELFPTEITRRVLSVSELTGNIRRVLEKEIATIWVTGEITNLRAQTSGHLYFTLKDARSQVSCVLFRDEATEVNREFLEDGQKVILHGDLTVYEPRGQYQLRVLNVELQGLGALQAAFEKLKKKLEAEGLFAQTRKRAIPKYPHRIGLVTSGTGAAIRDVLHVIQRRNPALRVILADCRVQGQGAAQEIACAINYLNDWAATFPKPPLDLILLTRGGGSLEDLWAFNEEIVARAIHGSRLPIISAVGHEIDFTISDFVADLRAATPSAAAEIITEGIFASRQFIAEASKFMNDCARKQLAWRVEDLQKSKQRLARLHPKRRLNEQRQRIDELHSSLTRCTRHHWRQKAGKWQEISGRFSRARPLLKIQARKEKLISLRDRLHESAILRFEQTKSRVEKLANTLRLLSPLNVLERGYSITRDAKTGKVLRAAEQASPGQEILSRLKSGEIRSTVR